MRQLVSFGGWSYLPRGPPLYEERSRKRSNVKITVSTGAIRGNVTGNMKGGNVTCLGCLKKNRKDRVKEEELKSFSRKFVFCES